MSLRMVNTMKRWLAGIGIPLVLASAASIAGGIPQPVYLSEDSSALLPLGDAWRDSNPYRDAGGETYAKAAEIGGRLYGAGCASCHGKDADGDRAPAPDLRGLHVYCKRVADPELRPRCDADVDAYFTASVLEGKTKVGIVHMPAWKGFLSQEQLWAIKSFIETRP